MNKQDLKFYVVDNLQYYVNDLKPLIRKRISRQTLYDILEQYGVAIPIGQFFEYEVQRKLIFNEHGLGSAEILDLPRHRGDSWSYSRHIANVMIASFFVEYAYAYIDLHILYEDELSYKEIEDMFIGGSK